MLLHFQFFFFLFNIAEFQKKISRTAKRKKYDNICVYTLFSMHLIRFHGIGNS